MTRVSGLLDADLNSLAPFPCCSSSGIQFGVDSSPIVQNNASRARWWRSAFGRRDAGLSVCHTDGTKACRNLAGALATPVSNTSPPTLSLRRFFPRVFGRVEFEDPVGAAPRNLMGSSQASVKMWVRGP